MASDGDIKSSSTAFEDPKAAQSLPDDNGEPQPERAQPLPPASSTDKSPTSPDPLVTHPAALAPETPGPTSIPTPAPQPRSWFASLSGGGSSNVPPNELAERPPSSPSSLPGKQSAEAVQPPADSSSSASGAAPLPNELPASVPSAHPPISEPEKVNRIQPERDIKIVPGKRAWFASSSSSKRPSKLRPMVDEPSLPLESVSMDPPAPDAPHLPAMSVIPPTPPKPGLVRVEGESPPSETVPVPIPAARRWFSPASSLQSRSLESEARAVLPSMGSQPAMGSPRSSTSIDEQVPKLPSAGPSPGPLSPLVTSDSSQNFSSFNPSTSRFSLSIPFLGRPKVPFDRAMASAQDADIRSQLDIPSVPSQDLPATEMGGESTLETAENLSVDSSPPGPIPEPVVSDGPTAQGSWWGLVGWRSATHMRTPSSAPDLPIEPLDHDSVAVSANTTPIENFSNTETHKHGSTLLAETPQVRGPSWLTLTPWSWYDQSITTPAPGTAQPEKFGANRVEAEPERPMTTEVGPELVLEVSVEQGPAHVEHTNPIQSSMKTNISGWASFFSSRSLLVKRIADAEHREEDTMEVMDVDEGDDEHGSTSALVSTEVRAGKDRIAREMRVSKLVSTPPRSSSPSPKPKAKPDDLKETKRTSVSPAPSKGSGRAFPRVPPPPNLVLPTWDDTFLTPPRSTGPRAQTDSALAKTMRFVSDLLFTKNDGASTGKGKARSKGDENFADFGGHLPRIWDVLDGQVDGDVLRGCKRVVVIGIHGWFPGAVMRTVLGEPTGTSNKFVSMMCQALDVFQERHGLRIEKVTQIPLEGEGTISKRVEKLYDNLTANREWMSDLHAADAILVATHSQGSIVSTHLLDRLIHEKHIKTSRTLDLLASASAALAPGGTVPATPSGQRVCCLALCGIHLGPLRYLSSSSLLQPYLQYFESAAAKELFEFQSTSSEVSKVYVRALRNVVDHGVKMVYIASLNDQVVPLYSGLFTAASHPLILRALYVDGDAYHSSDFLSNLLVLLLRVMNVGLSDSGLLTHLSEATAGSLNGIGHSKAYEELGTYSLAVNYLFMTNHGSREPPELVVQAFDANTELNDYEIPWALRDLIANEEVRHFFANDFADLRNTFPDWHPKTAILRDIKRKLQPIQRLGTTKPPTGSSLSKL